jgi:hypothetical protein
LFIIHLPAGSVREQAANATFGQQVTRDPAEHPLTQPGVPVSAGNNEVGFSICGETEKFAGDSIFRAEISFGFHVDAMAQQIVCSVV